MKKHFNTFVFSILAFAFLMCIGSLIVFFQWFVYDCVWPDCAPHRNFTIYDLDIPAGYLPNNASIKLKPDRGVLDAEEAFGSAAWINGQATYLVLKFGSENQAIQWFAKQSSQEMFDPRLGAQDQYPSVFNAPIYFADAHNILCGYIQKDFRCVFQAQYQEFYVFFSGSLGEGEMSDREFIGVMRFVDTKMNELLNSN